MGRIILVALTLAALAGLVWKATAPSSGTKEGASAPKRQLDNVREATKQIEANEQRAVDEIEKRAFAP